MSVEKVIHIKFNAEQMAYLNARAESECRKVSQIIKSAAVFYAKYGPWCLNNDEILIANMPKELRMKL